MEKDARANRHSSYTQGWAEPSVIVIAVRFFLFSVETQLALNVAQYLKIHA
jgi:hypothetical protein